MLKVSERPAASRRGTQPITETLRAKRLRQEHERRWGQDFARVLPMVHKFAFRLSQFCVAGSVSSLSDDEAFVYLSGQLYQGWLRFCPGKASWSTHAYNTLRYEVVSFLNRDGGRLIHVPCYQVENPQSRENSQLPRVVSSLAEGSADEENRMLVAAWNRAIDPTDAQMRWYRETILDIERAAKRAGLTEQEKNLLAYLLADPERTLRDIGKEMGFTGSRVQQIRVSLRTKLRAHVGEKEQA